MKNLLTAFAVLLTACGLGGPSAEYRQAVPKAETVQMNVPGRAGQALNSIGVRRDGLEGETAVFYQLTRGVSQFVNGAGFVVLSLVKAVTEYEPTKLDTENGVAVWGPYTEALSPNTWRLTVKKNKENDFSYVLEAKAKTSGDDAFLAILSGSHVTTGKNLGHGTFLLDFNAAQKLPEHDKDAVGTALYVYAHDSAEANVDVEATFTQVLDKETQRLIDATYHYLSNEKSGGSLEFQFQGDIAKEGTQLETATLNSRWDRSGAGRSDIKAKGGDLTIDAAASECWDSNFASRFLSASWDPNIGYGKDTSCGQFGDVQYSSLRL